MRGSAQRAHRLLQAQAAVLGWAARNQKRPHRPRSDPQIFTRHLGLVSTDSREKHPVWPARFGQKAMPKDSSRNGLYPIREFGATKNRPQPASEGRFSNRKARLWTRTLKWRLMVATRSSNVRACFVAGEACRGSRGSRRVMPKRFGTLASFPYRPCTILGCLRWVRVTCREEGSVKRFL